ncbi:hypothetical protein GCM10027168_53500 [Streptomyces capparidis]
MEQPEDTDGQRDGSRRGDRRRDGGQGGPACRALRRRAVPHFHARPSRSLWALNQSKGVVPARRQKVAVDKRMQARNLNSRPDPAAGGTDPKRLPKCNPPTPLALICAVREIREPVELH